MFMLQKMHALRTGSESGFPVNAVDLDGTNDYLTRGAGLTGAADSTQGILSFWLRLDGGDASTMYLFADDSLFVEVARNTSNKIYVNLYGTFILLSLTTTSTYTSGAGWTHVLMSWDTNFSAGNKLSHIYKNDVDDKVVSSDPNAAANVDYTRSNWVIGATAAGGSKLNGCLAEFYFAPGQYLDFSNSANRRKFISAAGKPVDLGVDGSLPTGTAPIIYLNNPAASFGTNKGTGGNFTITGTLDTASTSPSD